MLSRKKELLTQLIIEVDSLYGDSHDFDLPTYIDDILSKCSNESELDRTMECFRDLKVMGEKLNLKKIKPKFEYKMQKSSFGELFSEKSVRGNE